LGGRPNLLDPFPAKPKGMHWTTYNGLKEHADAAERDVATARDRLKAAVPHLATLQRDQLWDLHEELRAMTQEHFAADA